MGTGRGDGRGDVDQALGTAGMAGGKDGGGCGDGDGDGEDHDDYQEAEFSLVLGFDEVLRLAAARGVALLGNMMAKDAYIWEVLLLRYFNLQGRAMATTRDDQCLLEASQQDAR